MSEFEKALANIDAEIDRAVEEMGMTEREAAASAYENVIAAVRSESVGHVAQCKCCQKAGDIRYMGIKYCGLCGYRASDHPNVDDRCLPGLKREAIIRAEARVEGMQAIEDSHTGHFDRTGGSGSGCEVCMRNRAKRADARAELERLREK